MLRLTIISFFFLGGIVSGIFYSTMQMYMLLIAVAGFVSGVVYDSLKYRLIRLKSKYREHFSHK